MYTVFLERTHRVLLSCFTGTFNLDVIAQCDRAVMLTLGREGPVRGIIDLTGVDAVDIPEDALRRRAQQPPMVAGQERIYVASSPAALSFIVPYVSLQTAFGIPDPRIVATQAEACRLLGMADPKFEPIQLS